MCPAWGSVLMFLQGRWEQRYKTFPTLSEGWEPVIPGKRAERRVSGARVVREGFLEMVSLKRSTEKSQMVPARQNTGSWRQSQPGWRQRRGREAGGEVEGIVVCCRHCALGKSSHSLLHLGQRTLLPWDGVAWLWILGPIRFSDSSAGEGRSKFGLDPNTQTLKKDAAR